MAGVKGSVLIIDDDVDIRETITLILEEEGYKVTNAANGQAALAALRDGPRPELILLDLMMPVIDGIEFRTLEEQEPGLAAIPVVVITASGNAKDRAKTLRVDGIIQKPISLDTLLEVVERCTTKKAEPSA